MTARTIDLRVFVFIFDFPFKVDLKWGSKDTAGDGEEENPSVTSFWLCLASEDCTKFNRMQEEKIRKSIK